MLHDLLIFLQASSLLALKNTIEICHCVLHKKCHDNFLESSMVDHLRSLFSSFRRFQVCINEVFPHKTFLQPLVVCAWLKASHSKVQGGKSQMMCGITCFGHFGQIHHLMVVRPIVVRSMVVYLIVHSMTSFKFWMTKNPKFFQELIVKNNQSLENSRFNVIQFFCKIQKRQPFTRDLITSTHPKVPRNGCKWATKDTKPK